MDVDVDCLIGRGSYGSVFRGRDRRGRPVAIKVMSLVDDSHELGEMRAQIEREVSMMRSCAACENVLQYISSFERDEALWLVTELCTAGSLLDLMKLSGPLAEPPLAAALAGILAALSYLHGRHVLHRDLKCANVLLNADGCIKLADFGVSVELSRSLERRCTAIGTPHWMAPEVIQEDAYTSSADIWSLGITALELAERNPPLWLVKPVMRVLFRIPSDPPPTLSEPARWSAAFASWLGSCLRKDPAARDFFRTHLTNTAPSVRAHTRSPAKRVIPMVAVLSCEHNLQEIRRQQNSFHGGAMCSVGPRAIIVLPFTAAAARATARRQASAVRSHLPFVPWRIHAPPSKKKREASHFFVTGPPLLDHC